MTEEFLEKYEAMKGYESAEERERIEKYESYLPPQNDQ